MHVLRTETLGIRLKLQFRELLRKFDLLEKYEPAEIYSISEKIPVIKKGKIDHYLTDAEAIRHALAHNNYEIIYNADGWTIGFDNKDERDYKLNKVFKKQEFLRYIDDIEVLYKATQVLIYTSILREIARRYLILA